MKKATIIICAVIYALAIILVAFLGYQAEIKNPPVYADDIVLVQEVPYTHIENGVPIYTISEINHTEEPDNENKYRVHISDFEFLYYVLEGKVNIAAKPISNLVDDKGNHKIPDKLKLNYFTSYKNASIDSDGTITFTKYKDGGYCQALISTTDTSNITIRVEISW